MTERETIQVGCGIAIVAAVAMVIRCIEATHSGVWFTVAAAAAVVVGAGAGARGWTWGILLAAAAGASFAGAVWLGIAPPWFLLVATAAWLPAAAASRTLLRIDPVATVGAVALGVAVGAGGALAVREVGFELLDAAIRWAGI